MNEFRDKLKLQNLGIGVCCLVLAAFSFLSAASVAGIIDFMQPMARDSHWQSRWRGIVMGMSCAFLMLLIATLIRNILALADDRKLKKMYVQTNDERQEKIWVAARSSTMQIFLMVGVVASIVAGYFSVTVSITILACLFVLSMIGLYCKVYYSTKF